MKSLVNIDAKVMKHLNGKIFKQGIIYTIAGFVLTLVYVLCSFVFNIIQYNIWLTTICVLIISLGLLLIYSYSKAKSNSTKGDTANEIEFFDFRQKFGRNFTWILACDPRHHHRGVC